MSKKVVIGITDCGKKYPNYANWVLNQPGVEVIRLGSQLANLDDVTKCNGILLTGGDDIHPRFYNNDETHYPNAPVNFAQDRDDFEVKTFTKARENKIPVLGICRGLQLINCTLGGTLKQDLGELNEIHKRISKEDKIHKLKVSGNTLLRGITIEEGEVNSSHHQAIDKLGKNLKINCHAMDGTIEGIEGDEIKSSYLLAVQWHPERMLDQDSPFSKNIRDSFLKACS